MIADFENPNQNVLLLTDSDISDSMLYFLNLSFNTYIWFGTTIIDQVAHLLILRNILWTEGGWPVCNILWILQIELFKILSKLIHFTFKMQII